MSCRKIFFLYLLICGFSGISCSTIQKPFYWKIEKDGKTSYVLGTLHRGIELREFPKQIHRDLENTRAVVLEITTESEKDNSFSYINRLTKAKDLKEVIKRTLIKNVAQNKSVKGFFTPEQWGRIENKVVSEISINRAIVQYLSLQMIDAVVTDRAKATIPGYEYKLLTTKPLDLEIEGQAIQMKKPLHRLDSLQIMQPSCWDKMFVTSILFYLDNNKYDAIWNLVRLVEVYRSGDAEELIRETKEIDRDFEKCLLEERNARWIPIIQKYHSEESPVFIAAGALHFVGEGNVLELLIKEGYSVKRFPFK